MRKMIGVLIICLCPLFLGADDNVIGMEEYGMKVTQEEKDRVRAERKLQEERLAAYTKSQDVQTTLFEAEGSALDAVFYARQASHAATLVEAKDYAGKADEAANAAASAIKKAIASLD